MHTLYAKYLPEFDKIDNKYEGIAILHQFLEADATDSGLFCNIHDLKEWMWENIRPNEDEVADFKAHGITDDYMLDEVPFTFEHCFMKDKELQQFWRFERFDQRNPYCLDVYLTLCAAMLKYVGSYSEISAELGTIAMMNFMEMYRNITSYLHEAIDTGHYDILDNMKI